MKLHLLTCGAELTARHRVNKMKPHRVCQVKKNDQHLKARIRANVATVTHNMLPTRKEELKNLWIVASQGGPT